MRKTLAEASYLLDQVHLDLFSAPHNPQVEYIQSTGTTVRVWASDPWAYGDSELVGLKAGDKVWVDNNLYDFGPQLVTITAVNNDPNVDDGTWIEFKTETALDPALDDYASGTIWPGPDLVNVITVQRFWNLRETIKNEGTRIHVRYLGEW